MRVNQGFVYLVDDDSRHQDQVRAVAAELGLKFESIRDASQLAACGSSSQPSCLIVSDLALTQVEQTSGRLITDFRDYSSGGRLNLVGRGVATIVLCQHPDGHHPDVQKPDVQKPDVQKPDVQKPDVQKPDVQKPDVQKPDVQKPDVQKPDVQKPDVQKIDVQKIVRYMRAGALTVLPMPLEAESLSYWIAQAIEADSLRLCEEARLGQILNGYNHLSERKRTVLQHMIDGRASKWSAHELDVSRRTIELDRAEILNAFGVNNAIELARLMTETKCLPLNFSYSLTMGNTTFAMSE